MKLVEEMPPPPEIEHPPLHPPFASGREIMRDETTIRNKSAYEMPLPMPMIFPVRWCPVKSPSIASNAK